MRDRTVGGFTSDTSLPAHLTYNLTPAQPPTHNAARPPTLRSARCISSRLYLATAASAGARQAGQHSRQNKEEAVPVREGERQEAKGRKGTGQSSQASKSSPSSRPGISRGGASGTA